MLQANNVIDGPPKNAFLPLNALGTSMRNGIVLTGETTDQQVVGRNIVDNSGNVFVYATRGFFEVFLITLESPLSGLPWFPLVGPDSLKSRRNSFQADPKAADTSKKFDDTDIFSS